MYYSRKVFYIQSWMVSYRAVHWVISIYLPLPPPRAYINCTAIIIHMAPSMHIVQERSNEDISRHYSVTMLLKLATVICYATLFCLKCPFEMPPFYLFLKLPLLFSIPSFTLNMVCNVTRVFWNCLCLWPLSVLLLTRSIYRFRSSVKLLAILICLIIFQPKYKYTYVKECYNDILTVTFRYSCWKYLNPLSSFSSLFP